MLRTLAIVAATLVVIWLLFILFVFAVRPDGTSPREAARLLPDTLRLIRRLAGDREIPRRVRWLVWLLIGYLAMPIDLIPDFLPVVGYADDAILTSVVLRHVIHRSGPEKLRQHWPGSPEGLATLLGLLRLGDSN